MALKFAIGQAVEYRPAQQQPGLFKVVLHLPQEDGASDRRYRIKSLKEGFERTVSEYDLQPADLSEGAYPEPVNHPRLGAIDKAIATPSSATNAAWCIVGMQSLNVKWS